MKNLLEKRAKLIADARAILDAAQNDGREPTTEERAQFDSILATADALKADIDRMSRLEDEERALNGSKGRIVTGAIPADDAETRALDGYLRLGMETRALSTATDSAGGYLVPQQFANEMLKNLVLVSPIRGIARVTQVSGGEILLPKRTGTLSAAWVAENSDSSSSEPTFGQQTIAVHEARVFTDVSNRLLEDAAYDVAGELARDFAEEFGRLEGLAFVSGTGVGQPEGFLNSDDFTTIDAGATTLTDADKVIDLFYSLKTAYANRAVFMMNRATMAIVRKMKNPSTGEYLWQESLAAGQPPTLLGRPVIEVPDMDNVGPDSVPIVFGDMTQAYRIIDRIDLSVLRDPYSVAVKSQVRFHARRRVGGALVKGEAIKGLLMAAE